MSDVRLAVRALASAPFVTAVAVVSLALGIGANAAIFSLFEQVLRRPLPVPRPHELVNLSAPGPKPTRDSCNEAGRCEDVFSYPMFRDLQRERTGFSGIAAHRSMPATLVYERRAEGATAMLVSGSYFPVLGIAPALGRLIGPDDEAVLGETHVTVLSHDYWRHRFDLDPTVLGRTLIVNGRALTIVGVASPGFDGTTLGSTAKVFVPLSMYEAVLPGMSERESRRTYWLYLFARLAPGTSIDDARALANGVYRRILNEVEVPLQAGMSDVTMAYFKTKSLVVREGHQGQSVMQRAMAAPVTLLFVVSAVVWLIACLNVANLLLVRAVGRAGETALRLSLGASRRHLVARVFLESALLALLGGAAAVFVAGATLGGVRALLPAQWNEALRFSLDAGTLAFIVGLSVLTALLSGLLPSWQGHPVELLGTLKDRAAHVAGGSGGARVRAALATGQIALATTLLIGAGLFTRSLFNVARVDLGLDVDEVVSFRVAPRLSGYSETTARAFYERLEGELAVLPGVVSAAAARIPVLAQASEGGHVSVEGFPAGPDTNVNSRSNFVGAAFFRTMGMTVLSGRDFTPSDVEGAPRVAIVNEAFVEKFQLGRSAVGRRMATQRLADRLDLEIVGVVSNAKYNEVKGRVPPTYYLPYRQREGTPSMYFYARTRGAAPRLAAALPALVTRLDPNIVVEELKSVRAQVRENVFLDHVTSLLSAAFAVVATLLAAVGLYGVLAYAVAQRTREIGVRMALGADAGRVRGLVLRQVARMTLVGGAAGLAAALALGRSARALLFELEPHDPVAIAIAIASLMVVALAAGLVPATRAARIEPLQALRVP